MECVESRWRESVSGEWRSECECECKCVNGVDNMAVSVAMTARCAPVVAMSEGTGVETSGVGKAMRRATEGN